MSLRDGRGLTLTETIISIFLLTSGFIVMFRLMHAALQFQSGIDSQQTAVMLAERQTERIRAWSHQVHGPGGGTPFSDWSACPGAGGPAPISDYPAYQLTVDSLVQQLYSPCSLFELSYLTPSQRRSLDSSCRRLTVTVSWKNRSFGLTTLVGAPTGEPASSNPVSVSPNTPLSIVANGVADFNASATDSDGRAIPDLFFEWYIAGVGDGTLQPARDGRQAHLVNQIFDASLPPNPTGVGVGPCLVIARGRYRGKEIQGASGLLDLLP